MLCRIAVAALTLAYLLAIAIFLIGTLGLFGQEPDPLSGVYLIPLGLPWNQFADLAPEPAWPWLAALAPIVNLVVLAVICRWRSRQKNAGAQ